LAPLAVWGLNLDKDQLY
jgi:ADP-ribosylglycohydrolase